MFGGSRSHRSSADQTRRRARQRLHAAQSRLRMSVAGDDVYERLFVAEEQLIRLAVPSSRALDGSVFTHLLDQLEKCQNELRVLRASSSAQIPPPLTIVEPQIPAVIDPIVSVVVHQGVQTDFSVSDIESLERSSLQLQENVQSLSSEAKEASEKLIIANAELERGLTRSVEYEHLFSQLTEENESLRLIIEDLEVELERQKRLNQYLRT